MSRPAVRPVESWSYQLGVGRSVGEWTDHLFTAPRSPTTTGKIERWHKMLHRELLNVRVFASIADAQAAVRGPR